MTERITFLTPVGVSKYPYVQQADTAFGQNKYKTSLVLDKFCISKNLQSLHNELRYIIITKENS